MGDVVDDVTGLINASAQGDVRARDELYARIYEQLRQLARRQMRQERAGHTLQPTAVVNEAFLRLVEGNRNWDNRKHFFLSAASAMRRVLIDHARARRAAKRGSGGLHLSLLDSDAPVGALDVNLLDLEQALAELERLNPRLARIMELRYFAGFNVEETAEALELSTATVKREWSYARAWLIDRMGTHGA